MAVAKRTTPDSIEEVLRERPFDLDFFQAVRHLENLHADLPRVGRSARPADDPVRFGQHVSLSFSPTALHTYTKSEESEAARLSVNFFGLLGTHGPLPHAITEYVFGRTHNLGDHTLARFLDMFNHRMLSLFYRAWAVSQQTVSHDRPGDDWYARYIGSLLGCGLPSFQNRDHVPDELKLHFAGHLACPAKHPEGLTSLLQDYLECPVALQEFIGQWIDLEKEDRCQLGRPMPQVKLGQNTVLGERIWVCQQRFRLRIGPLDLPAYRDLLPGGRALCRVVDWVRLYTGHAYSWELQLVIKRDSIPRIRLGQFGNLGWSTWVFSDSPPHDSDDFLMRDPLETPVGSSVKGS